MGAPAAAEHDPDELINAIVNTAEGQADPYPRYAALRAVAPVFRTQARGVVVVSRYADSASCLRDNRFGKGPTGVGQLFPAPGAEVAPPELSDLVTTGSMVFLDPPEHTRVRRFVSRSFTSRSVEQLRPYVERVTDRLLDELEERGTIDLVHDFAFRIPVDVIGELVGVPPEDRPLVHEWIQAAIAVFDPLATPEAMEEAAPAARDLAHYFSGLVRRKRRTPGDDLISRLLAEREGDDRMSRSELVATMALLFGAGFESTAYLISTGVATLLQRPDQLAGLVADPARWPVAVEEALRYEAVFQVALRRALEPVELGGFAIDPGDWVLVLVGSANRDPDGFTDPDLFDGHRYDSGRDGAGTTNPHLAFSSGAHHCLGAPLARIEAAVAFERLFRRFPHLHTTGAEPVWRSIPFRQIDGLQVST